MTKVKLNPPKYHRELFKLTGRGADQQYEAVSEYTAEQVWKYFQLSFLGKNSTIGARSYISREDLDQLADNILSEADKMTGANLALIERICNKFGVEVLLFAIDSLSDASTQDTPDFDDVIQHIRDGEVTISRLDMENKVNGN